MTPKQRMLNAYRGIFSDVVPVAPEFWYYYPAKLLGVDMITFQREVPFHEALRTTFDRFACEGWGLAFSRYSPPGVDTSATDRWIERDTLEVATTIKTPRGVLTGKSRYDRHEPSWSIERPIKDPVRDLPSYEAATIGNPGAHDFAPAVKAWREVGESYLLEYFLGATFFDYYATAREGGLETAIVDFIEMEDRLMELQRRYIDHITQVAARVCEETPFESLFIGCAWSTMSLISPTLWRRWDKPVLKAAVDTVHRYGRHLHVHLHGRCLDVIDDLAELGIDCVCPFERPPGGDVAGQAGLVRVADALDGRVTMNGNVHTVETLIRGAPDDARREVREIMAAFGGNPRVIIGTGDQVGGETPVANLHAMIDEARHCSNDWHRGKTGPVSTSGGRVDVTCA